MPGREGEKEPPMVLLSPTTLDKERKGPWCFNPILVSDVLPLDKY